MKCNRPGLHAPALFLLLALSGCGGDATDVGGSEHLPSPVPEGIEEGHPVSGPEGQLPVSPEQLASLPYVYAGQRQYTDTNVVVSLHGEANAAEGAEIVQSLWTQIGGPEVTLPYPGALHNMILIPDWQEPAQLEFRLIAVDSQGRINSSTTTIVVQPQPRFLTVAGTDVEAGAELVVFRLSLSGPSSRPVTVTYTTESGTAVAGVDFEATSGEIVFEPEQLIASVSVPLLNNPDQREDLVFHLTVTQITNSELSANQGAAIIRYFEGPAFFDSVDFNALIGPTSSQIRFMQPVHGYQLIQTHGDPCLPQEILTCADANFRSIEALVFDDDILTWEFDGFFWLALDEEVSHPFYIQGLDDSSSLVEENGAPPARSGHHLLSFNDHFWLIGGRTLDGLENSIYYDDIWRSADGIYWEQVTSSVTGNSELYNSFDKALVHNNQLWLLDSYNDTLHYSADGVTWTALPDQGLNYSYSYDLFSFNNRLLFIGSEMNYEPSLWSYSIAEDEWENESPVTGLTFFFGGGQIVTFDNRLWMIGSMDGSSSNNVSGIWVSDNGYDWEPAQGVSSTINFSSQAVAHLVASDAGMWLAYSSSDMEVVYSPNGLEWESASGLPGESGMIYEPALGTFNGRLWLQGGTVYGYDSENDQNTVTHLSETWTTESIDWQRVFRGTISFPPNDPDNPPVGSI